MSNIEKRKFKRLPIMLDLSCCKAGSKVGKVHKGRTFNVSPGGLYFECEDIVFTPGNLLQIELSIPPTVGLLESGGSVSGIGTVLRIDMATNSQKNNALPSARCGIALEFSRPLKLCL